MNTLSDVKRVSDIIKPLQDADVKLGEIFRRVKSKEPSLTTSAFLRASQVASGDCLPEVALLTCPAADYLLQLSIDDQTKYVTNRTPFGLLRIMGRLEEIELLAYDQLSERDCQQLFPFQPMIREMAAALDGDEAFVEFQGDKMVSFTRIHRDTHSTQRKPPE